ncbi:hypothetical protein [Rhizobium sp.]|jgi:hypothetical protein|uniref:hypothetical protein n=1 Tax=Rhizobium sp. TaxID=391 RepID=UPI000E916E95|nr:hypothetical protein [Rhizobium sp.]
MRHSVSGPALLAALTLIQGCTVSDTLTPPLDVGTSGSISKPLTRTDMQTAMEQNQSGYAPVSRREPEQAYPGSEQQMASTQPSPQNSLDAQAQALQNGYNPVASTPLDNAPTQPVSRRHRAAHRQPVENPQSPRQQPMPVEQQANAQAETVGEDEADTQAQSPVAVQQSQQQASIAPAGAQGGAIRFLPIIGAPSQVMLPLSRQLGVEARQKGLVLRDSSGEPAQHILKGYFSAYADGDRTVVVYVWDILDASGNRLHRIQGQETVPGKAKDPWASVSASTMQSIATRTVDDYLKWQSKSTG